jgi:uncharacterized protein YjdB
MRSHLGACILALLAMAAAGCRDSSVSCLQGIGYGYEPSVTTIHVAATYRTSFQLRFDGCGTQSGGFTWLSTTPSVATVDGTGLVTGIAPGQAIISVTGRVNGQLGSTRVTVAP